MKFKLGESVQGDVLFGNGLRLKGVVIKQDAGISRDAIVVRTDSGATAVMLESSVENHA